MSVLDLGILYSVRHMYMICIVRYRHCLVIVVLLPLSTKSRGPCSPVVSVWRKYIIASTELCSHIRARLIDLSIDRNRSKRETIGMEGASCIPSLVLFFKTDMV